MENPNNCGGLSMITQKQIITVALAITITVLTSCNRRYIREESAIASNTPVTEYRAPTVSAPVIPPKQVYVIFPGGMSIIATLPNPSPMVALIDSIFVDGVMLQTDKLIRVYDYTGSMTIEVNKKEDE